LVTGSALICSCKKREATGQNPPNTDSIPGEITSTPKDTFFITDYGAKGNGTFLNTTAVQATIDSAAAHEGVAAIPAGNFLCGPVVLASHMTLLIEQGATLTLRNDIGTYPATAGQYLHFISASNATDITVTGSGTVDGQGSPWWTAFKANTLPDRRPQLFYFDDCRDIKVTGIHTLNPPNTHFSLRNCDSVIFDDVTITAPSTSPNTDGINLCGNQVLISDCNIQTGDDNIAFSEGGGHSSDIEVKDCALGYGHGLSIGSYTKYGLDGLSVDSCTFDGTTSGIRMKSSRDRGGLVRHLSYSNITMTNVRYPVFISSYYPKTPAAPQDDPAQAITATTPQWKNIELNNISISGCPNSVLIWGVPEMDVDSVQFNHVNISATSGMQIYFAKDISFKDCSIDIKESPELKTYHSEISGL
jgi:polygalacturonase